MPKVPITVMGYRCGRCAYEWVPRGDAEPLVCPKCKSPYWNKPMVRKRAGSAGDAGGDPVGESPVEEG